MNQFNQKKTKKKVKLEMIFLGLPDIWENQIHLKNQNLSLCTQTQFHSISLSLVLQEMWNPERDGDFEFTANPTRKSCAERMGLRYGLLDLFGLGFA